jgi:hypothetical protein
MIFPPLKTQKNNGHWCQSRKGMNIKIKFSNFKF